MPVRKPKEESTSTRQDDEEEPPEFLPPPSLEDIQEEYEAPPAPHPEAEIPSAVLESAATFFVYGVDILHAKVADATQYQDWNLTDKEREMWQYLAKELIPHLPLKYAVLLMVAFSLSIAEGSKVAGYLRYQRALQAQARLPTEKVP